MTGERREHADAPRDVGAAPARCPRCGARLGTAASAALADQRRALADGAPVAVPEAPAFCGCCGLLIATGA